MSQNYYATVQCQRFLLSYLVNDIKHLAMYAVKLEAQLFTSKAREWIFLILKKNFLYSQSLTSKELFYIEMQQQLDARQEKYGQEIMQELDIVFGETPKDSIELIIRKLEQANIAAQLVNVMQTTHGYLSTGNVEDAIDAYRKATTTIQLTQKTNNISGLFANSQDFLADIRKRKEDPEKYAGLKTGFVPFDNSTGGLFPAELTIFFGLSGKGKSTVLKNICDRVSQNGHNILFVPNEENKVQVETKFTSMMTNIPGYKFKRGMYSQKEYELTQKFLTHQHTRGQVFIYPLNQGVDATVIERQFRDLESKGQKIDLICVDYLDLMGSPFKTYSEWDEQAKITNSLKQLAINCDVPVLTCTQAAIESEKQEKKDNPFLTQSDVYGAKAKVHTANTLVGLVNKTASQDVADISDDDNRQKIHRLVLCVCKNRDGANFAFKQKMYAQTGLMVQDNDGEEVDYNVEKNCLDQQQQLRKNLQEIIKLDSLHSNTGAEDSEKLIVNNQLGNLFGQKEEKNNSTNQDEEFLDEDFDYMAGEVSIEDYQVLEESQGTELLDDFLNSTSDTTDVQQVVNEIVISQDETTEQLQIISNETEENIEDVIVEEIPMEEVNLIEQNKVEKPKMSAYELFKNKGK